MRQILGGFFHGVLHKRMLSMERSCHLWLFELLHNYLTRNPFLNDVLIRTCCCPLNKGEVMAGTSWELPAVSSLTMSWLGLLCSHIVCAAHHRAESHPACAAQHRPALLRLDFIWISSSQTCNSFPVEIYIHY